MTKQDIPIALMIGWIIIAGLLIKKFIINWKTEWKKWEE